MWKLILAIALNSGNGTTSLADIDYAFDHQTACEEAIQIVYKKFPQAQYSDYRLICVRQI